jgi:hypothetical protein
VVYAPGPAEVHLVEVIAMQLGLPPSPLDEVQTDEPRSGRLAACGGTRGGRTVLVVSVHLRWECSLIEAFLVKSAMITARLLHTAYDPVSGWNLDTRPAARPLGGQRPTLDDV